MAVKRSVVWVFLMLSIVLAVGASAMYYWSGDSGDRNAQAVRGLSLLGAGREASADASADTIGLPVVTKKAASLSALAKAMPRPPFPPRQMVEVALQSGTPKDAYFAAWAIRRCKDRASAAKALEKIHERGIRAAPSPLSETISPYEAAERACQELDDSMKAQYEPMLRKAMEGGERGAAAMWWGTAERMALGNAAGETEALDLLRRDTTQCDLLSFGTYKVAAAQFPNKFDANEVAAVYAATDQLFKDNKLKNNTFEKAMRLFPLPQTRSTAVDESVVKDMTAKILNTCAS